MEKIKLLARKILEKLPASWFNKIMCFNYNVLWRRKILNYIPNEFKFKINYQNGLFVVNFKNFTLKFKKDPFSTILSTPLEGYLKYYQLKNGDYVVDGGAYVGIFTMIASQLVGDNGLVIAFEPDPENYAELSNNIEINNLNNVILLNKGLWAENTFLNFQNVNLKCSSISFDDKINEETISVEVVSLDHELNELGISLINFIKLDIECAEIEFLKGAKNLLINSKCNLAIASYHIVDGSKTYIKLEKELKKMGYKTKTTFPKHLTTYACN